MKATIIITVLMCLTLTSKAQVISIGSDSIVWSVDQLTDLLQNQTQSYECKFITSAEGIVWLQRDDDYQKTLAVSSVSGNWSDLSSDGFYQYAVTFQNRSGTLRFEKASDTVTIRMSFVENGKDTMPFLFHVKSISKL
jgi:hypothetical protein